VRAVVDVRKMRVLENVDQLAPEDLEVLCDFVEENDRRGHYDRIFPLKSNVDKYAKYFESQRHNN